MKPGIPDNTSKCACFHICTNMKSAIDHSTGSTGAFLVIDSLVRLSVDTAPNRARATEATPPLKSNITGEERLVSFNGGRPFAVLQLEHWNPSTPTQKINNLEQVLKEHPELDSCQIFPFTDKVSDHNPCHFEAWLRYAQFFMTRKF